MRRSRAYISIPLLLIATLHFIVYFSATTQVNAQTFFVRESANTKNISIQDLNQYQYTQTEFAKFHLYSLLFALEAARGVKPFDAGLGQDPQLSTSALRTALSLSRLSQAHFLGSGLELAPASDTDGTPAPDSSPLFTAAPVATATA
jgi:hypothetical protein